MSLKALAQGEPQAPGGGKERSKRGQSSVNAAASSSSGSSGDSSNYLDLVYGLATSATLLMHMLRNVDIRNYLPEVHYLYYIKTFNIFISHETYPCITAELC